MITMEKKEKKKGKKGEGKERGGWYYEWMYYYEQHKWTKGETRFSSSM